MVPKANNDGITKIPMIIEEDTKPTITVSVQRQNLPMSPLLRGFLWGTAFSFISLVSGIFGAALAIYTPLSEIFTVLPKIEMPWLSENEEPEPEPEDDSWRSKYVLGRPVNVLVMGVDRVPEALPGSPEMFAGHSDTILLLRFDPANNAVKILSIPRDTRVDHLTLSVPKINQANADGGAELAAKVVSSALNDTPIHRYVRVTTGAFRELVDLLGGIEIYVPQKMSYVDVTQNLNIDLEPGWQTLNGEQAEQFARFRADNRGDVGRVQRQQALLKALKKRLQNPLILPRLPKAIKLIGQYIDTNLNLEELIALVSFSLKLEKDDFQMVLLPGRFSSADEYQLSYWLPDDQAKDRLVAKYFDQLPTEIDFSQSTRTPLTYSRIAIENTTDEPGLARSVANYLARNNFYNLYFIDKRGEPLETSEIIVQKGDLEAAETVQKILGLGIIESSSLGDLKSDLTIRVGKDWQEYQDYKETRD